MFSNIFEKFSAISFLLKIINTGPNPLNKKKIVHIITLIFDQKKKKKKRMEDVLDKSVSLILLRFFVSGALIHGYLRRTQHEMIRKIIAF